MEWSVETLNATVDKELHALPVDMRARFVRICELIASVGLERMSGPHVKRLTGPLWGMRMRGQGGIARALYVSTKNRRVVVVRAFVKKTMRTPRREIELALRRAAEVTK
ncbi:MAG: type II toxin-antitoxin system RelE/ParE family toxin [Acidobacteria bacterium]|nr:type II toxin-antitoxin system RelE/ParE family toxin [Acidobacteriota bacterium]